MVMCMQIIRGKKMKKTLFTIMFLLMMSSSYALLPEPVELYFTYSGVAVVGIPIQIIHNGESITMVTNEVGAVLVTLGEGGDFDNPQTSFPKTLTVNCGTNCGGVYTISNVPYVQSISLSTAPAVTCPSTSCPSCSSGSSGGSYCPPITSENCAEKFPCVVPEAKVCPPEKICTSEECTSVVCPACNVGECPINECDSGVFGVVWAIILSIIGSGGAVYVSLDKFGKNKVKLVRVDGNQVVFHKHPLISGYHNPNVVHKENAHIKGEIVPKYEKNDSGEWEYVG